MSLVLKEGRDREGPVGSGIRSFNSAPPITSRGQNTV